MKNKKLRDGIVSIEVAAGKTERVRKVVTGSNLRKVWEISSITSLCYIQAESEIERDAILLFDINPNVISIREQPAIIHYVLNGQIKRHFPDLLISYADGQQEFIEIKSDIFASRIDTTQRTKLLINSFNDINGKFNYRLLQESEIRKGDQVKNSELIRRVAQSYIDPNIENEVIEYLKKQQAAKVANLASLICDYSFAKDIVCALYLNNRVTFDLSQPLEHAVLEVVS